VRRRLLALLAVASLTLAACDPGELLDYVGDALSTDMAESEDPTLRAAGRSAADVAAEEEARTALDVAVATRDPLDAVVAERARPTDPRYTFYTAVLAGAADEGGVAFDAIQRGSRLVVDQHPDLSSSQRARIASEYYLDAVRHVLEADDDFENRDELVHVYCTEISGGHTERFSDQPTEVAFFLSLQVNSAVAQRDC
jgi:hypothetical protein